MADSKDQDLCVTSALEKEAVSSNSTHELFLLTTIKGPLIANEARESRAPIDLVAVIDRSGSMSGPKLELVLKTMAFVVEQLKDKDQLCVIAYDTNVEVSLPFTPMTVDGKKLATEKLSKIRADSSTNLSGGLLKGIEQMIQRTTKNEVASIMIFTDGQANVGLTKTYDIVKAINQNIEKIDSACSIFSFGYGADHDETMLKEIAEAGKGLYYYIETLDDIPRSFGDCLGGLMTVAAQNITLKLEGVNGISMKNLVSKVKGAEKAAGPVVELNLGDIYSEESRDIVALFTIPAIATPNPEFFPAVNVTLSYFDVRTSSISQKVSTVYLKRPLEAPANQSANLQIDKQRNRLTAASAMEQATSLKNDSSSRAQGRTILQSAIDTINKSVSSNEKFSQSLVADLRSSLMELEDKTIDYSMVQKKMYQKAHAHSRQRGHYSSDMYDNSGKMEMKQMATASLASASSSSNNNNNANTKNNNNNVDMFDDDIDSI